MHIAATTKPRLNALGSPVQIHRHWTPYEDGQLRNHLHTVGYREMARRLNRTYAAVRLRAFNLGLTSKEPEQDA